MEPIQEAGPSADQIPDSFAPLVLAGLGNPGERYGRTRHNAGFLVLERMRAAAAASWRNCGDREECRVEIAGRERLLVRPLTFMNRSGLPLRRCLADGGFTPSDLLVILDDVALPAGRLRLRRRGGTGGHNGLVSICDSLATQEIARLRLGVGPAPAGSDLAEYVLEPLEGDAWAGLLATVEEGAEAVRLLCAEGLAAAMNRFHAPPAAENGGS